MFKILEKTSLNPTVSKMKVHAPLIAKKVLPGQFIILRIDEKGERIPLTVFDHDFDKEYIEIIYQKVGLSTMKLDQKKVGDYILDVAGPLGRPSIIEENKKAIVIAGGVGTAVAYPLAQEIKNKKGQVEIIVGFRTKSLVILENYINQIDPLASIVTDDGSYGRKGLVTDVLSEKLSKNSN